MTTRDSSDRAEQRAEADAFDRQRVAQLVATPGAITPAADPDGLRELGATEFYPRVWQYRDPKNTLEDLMKPGFFTGEARARLRLGDEIHYCMQGGKKLPSEWTRGVCVIEEIPNTKELPVILAGYIRYSKATPWRVGEAEQPQAA